MKKKFLKEYHKYVLLMPGVIFFCFALVIPFAMGFQIAFTDWDGLSLDYNYNGIDNFTRMFKGDAMLDPLLNTLQYGVLGTIAGNVVALSLATLVAQKLRFANLLKTIVFIPACLSTVLVAFLWKFIYREVVPLVFGINNPLGNADIVIPAIIVMTLWSSIGINMLIYLAAIKNVPVELYEASVVDGANAYHKFRFITIPMIVPAFTVCITLTLTSYLREFALTYAATNGGPAGASQTVSIYIYENLYLFGNAGYAQAVALVFMAVLVTIGLTVSRAFRKKEVEL